MSEVRGIPTIYNSQRFRSLVEARWASFFDELAWPWEYEPFELDGYIPDFVLKFPKPILVEVKADLDLESLSIHASKIAASGWKRECLIVGATTFCSSDSSLGDEGACIGLLGHADPYENECGLDNAVLCRCTSGKTDTFSINQALMDYSCRLHGLDDHWKSLEIIPPEEGTAIWRTASNRVQWRGR